MILPVLATGKAKSNIRQEEEILHRNAGNRRALLLFLHLASHCGLDEQHTEAYLALWRTTALEYRRRVLTFLLRCAERKHSAGRRKLLHSPGRESHFA